MTRAFPQADRFSCGSLRDPLEALFARARIPRHVVVTVPSFTVAAEVVAASDLVTRLTTSLLAAKGHALGLRAIDVSLPARAVPIAMCWHDRTHADPAARAFRVIVKGVVAVSPGRPDRGAR